MDEKVDHSAQESESLDELHQLKPVSVAILGLDSTRAQPQRVSRNLDKAACRRVRCETGLYREEILEIGKRYPGDLKRQIGEVMALVVFKAATGVVRESSIETGKSTRARWVTFVGLLKKINMPVPSLDKIGAKHVRAIIQAMEAKRNKPAYMANMLSAMRRLLTWVGKPDAVAALEDLVKDKKHAKRSIVAVVPRTLESLGINPEQVFGLMDAECRLAGLLLRLMYRFGLRPKEAVCLVPHRADLGSDLWVKDGTKGGLERWVPIECPEQRRLLEACKREVADPANSVTESWGLALHQAMSRLYYLARKIGLHAGGSLGTTMYGFRRSYAIRVYELVAGEKAPVLGGRQLPLHEQVRVELEVSRRLGVKLQ